MIDFKDYIKGALETERRIPEVKQNPAFVELVLRTAIYSSVMADQLKKLLYMGRPIDKVKMRFAAEIVAGCADELWLLGQHGYVDTKVPRLSTVSDQTDGNDHVLNLDPRLLHCAIGKFTESGELLNALYVAWTTGKPLDVINFVEELGDDAWYTAIGLDELGINFDDVLAKNSAKLANRKEQQRLAADLSARDLVAERAILEGNSEPAVKEAA